MEEGLVAIRRDLQKRKKRKGGAEDHCNTGLCSLIVEDTMPGAEEQRKLRCLGSGGTQGWKGLVGSRSEASMKEDSAINFT